ncbi:MAG: hypothetical protein JWO67_2564 [Streptosporangiaceae bacterium]|nr:hypothetical protein [Streptosporangiaceae bacterium]
MTDDMKRYTLEEARQIIRREAAEKVCGTLGHDLMIQTAATDRAGGVVLGRREPTLIMCKFCYREWDVVPRG